MNKLVLYDQTKTYMYPNGEIAPPERIQADFPAITSFQHVIETDAGEEICFAVMSLSAMKSNYNIDMSLTKEEAVAQLNTAIVAQRTAEANPGPSAEERIAAALEYQNLLSM